MRKVVIFATIAVVATIAIISGVMILSATLTNASSKTTYSIENLVSSSSGVGSSALRFTVSENATNISPGGALNITMSEFNTLDITNNVSSSSDNWTLPSILDWWPCQSPIQFAIFSGYFTISNITQATPLPLFPPGFGLACPNPHFYKSFEFAPSSASATYVPSYLSSSVSSSSSTSSFFTTSSALSGSTIVHGYYSTADSTITYTNGTQPMVIPFSQGIYTVAAGDEWGGLGLIYFVVN